MLRRYTKLMFSKYFSYSPDDDDRLYLRFHSMVLRSLGLGLLTGTLLALSTICQVHVAVANESVETQRVCFIATAMALIALGFGLCFIILKRLK